MKVPSLPKNADIIAYFSWKNSFETVMERRGGDRDTLLFHLQGAVEDENLKRSIMNFPYNEEGYYYALTTLEMRFGNEQEFKLAIYSELEVYRGKIDFRTGKGYWDLVTLLQAILCNTLFANEGERNSVLYTKVASIFPKYLMREYNLKYEEHEQRVLNV